MSIKNLYKRDESPLEGAIGGGNRGGGRRTVSPTTKDMQKPSGRDREKSVRVKGKEVGRLSNKEGKAAGTGRGTKVEPKTLAKKTKRKMQDKQREDKRKISSIRKERYAKYKKENKAIATVGAASAAVAVKGAEKNTAKRTSKGGNMQRGRRKK